MGTPQQPQVESLSLPLDTLSKDDSKPLLPKSLKETENGTPMDESDSESDDSPPTTMKKTQRSRTATSEVVAFRPGHRKQLSLYSWMSNTPTTSPPASRTKDLADDNSSGKALERERGKLKRGMGELKASSHIVFGSI